MPIVGYKIEFMEEGNDWTKAQVAEFKRGLLSSYRGKLKKVQESEGRRTQEKGNMKSAKKEKWAKF